MMTVIKKTNKQTAPPQPLWKQLLWMIAIWGASVSALFVVASLFRLLMISAGLKLH